MSVRATTQDKTPNINKYIRKMASKANPEEPGQRPKTTGPDGPISALPAYMCAYHINHQVEMLQV